jgi:DNA topoisomerase-1
MPTTKKNPGFLVIVESPSKCAKIEGFLGNEYTCIASKGHLREIKGLDAISITDHFAPTFTIMEDKKEHIKEMKRIIKQYDKARIFLATDDDREGEAIAWHICQLFDLSVETTPRIVFHEITAAALKKAVQAPGRIDIDLVYCQIARQVLDIMIGYKISPTLWKYVLHSKANSLSAGRCQTPALRLVYDHHCAYNRTVVGDVLYKIKGSFFTQNVVCTLNKEFRSEEEVGDFLEASKEFQHIFEIGSEKESIQKAPTPFNTSRLLQTASSQLRFSPKRTMQLCQQLYQDGHITYMRTESTHYSKEFLKECSEYILGKHGETFLHPSLESIEQKDATNPHEAIRVTHVDVFHMTEDEDSKQGLAALYKLIWCNTVQSCMSDAHSKKRELRVLAPMDSIYQHILEIPTFLGWKAVKNHEDDESTTSDKTLLFFLQSMASKISPYQYIKSEATIHSQRPAHYTEASLIHQLELLGIGRPSTYASLVNTIQDRGYVICKDIKGTSHSCKEYTLRPGNLGKKGKEGIITVESKEYIFGQEKRKLVIQPIGTIAIEFLTTYFDLFFSYDYTKKMEIELDSVTRDDWTTICEQSYKDITTCIEPLSTLSKQKYKIDDMNEVLFGIKGPYIKEILENGDVEFKAIKKEVEIDLKKLMAGGYTLDDLLETKERVLGTHGEHEISLHRGKYGAYIEWNGKRVALKSIESCSGKGFDDIELRDVLEKVVEVATPIDGNAARAPPQAAGKDIVRLLNSSMSVRKGKFGHYIFYHEGERGKKPQFLPLKKCPYSYLTCDADLLVKWTSENLK